MILSPIKKISFGVLIIIILAMSFSYFRQNLTSDQNDWRSVIFNSQEQINPESLVKNEGGLENIEHPLSISYMRNQQYLGSEMVIEQELASKNGYQQFIASYKSEGLKIYGLLTIPSQEKPQEGWPAIIFNHGYIPPEQYRTTQRYENYVDAFARNGYVVFKPDYRGHGNSEGKPEGAYYSPAYTIDVLNAISSIKMHSDVDPTKIGMWGHSMGGHLTLRSMVINDDIKAGVIWAGVVASYEDMLSSWSRSRPWTPSMRESEFPRPSRQKIIETYGDFQSNPDFWNQIAPINFVDNISGPVQIHHGTADSVVPTLFSELLRDKLSEVEKEVEFYSYEGDDHNISNNFSLASRRSVEFFDKYLKENN